MPPTCFLVLDSRGAGLDMHIIQTSLRAYMTLNADVEVQVLVKPGANIHKLVNETGNPIPVHRILIGGVNDSHPPMQPSPAQRRMPCPWTKDCQPPASGGTVWNAVGTFIQEL